MSEFKIKIKMTSIYDQCIKDQSLLLFLKYMNKILNAICKFECIKCILKKPGDYFHIFSLSSTFS